MKTMAEITIPATTITPEQYDYNARQLIATVLYRAVNDYCYTKSDKKKAQILNDLRSSRMDIMSDGMSIITAEQLVKNGEDIKSRILRDGEEI